MRVVTITCDRCKRETEVHQLKIEVGERSYSDPFKQAEWCRDCLISVLGVGWQPSTPSVKPPDPLPTIEDMIREIAGEAAIDAVTRR